MQPGLFYKQCCKKISYILKLDDWYYSFNSGGPTNDGFFQRAELEQGGSVTIGATLSNLQINEICK